MLIIALIVLVAMTLAGLAMVRSVDVSSRIAGNLAFREASTHAADMGIEIGRKWLMSTTDDLTGRVTPQYYATWEMVAFDPTTFAWDDTTSSAEVTDAAGNRVRYVIHRMCENTGPSGTAGCVTAPGGASQGNSQRIVGAGEFQCIAGTCASSSNPYYRITARAVGPRNAVTYVQTVIY